MVHWPESSQVPTFREPLGTGTVINLAAQQCIDVDIVIQDDDSPMVTITDPMPITGGQLTIVDGQTATWHWCPTSAQIAAQARYTLVLSADDGDNPPTIKNYVIVLSRAGPHLVINEIDYDQVGNDTAEYVEIFNPGATMASLAGLQLVLVNGSSGTGYATIDLSPAGSLSAGKYLVIGGAMVIAPVSAKKLDPVWSLDQIQNGAPDGLALIDSVTHTAIDALSYEGSITMVTIPSFPAPISVVEGTPLATSVADSNTVTRSLCRIPNGTDSNNAAADWVACGTLTPGAANAL